MCQLLGMNCNTPTDIMFSFEGFRRGGGITDHHADGFGIGFSEGKGVRLFHDDKPSANSRRRPRACLPNQTGKRHRTYPQSIARTNLAGEHPSLYTRNVGRILGRRSTTDIWLIFPEQGRIFSTPSAQPIPNALFCHSLNRLRTRFLPPVPTRRHAVSTRSAGLTHEINKFKLLNFMLSDSALPCLPTPTHCCTTSSAKPRSGKARLLDDDVWWSILPEVTTPSDRAAVIATPPLTRDKSWSQLAVDKLVPWNARAQQIVRHEPSPKAHAYMSAEEAFLKIARAACYISLTFRPHQEETPWNARFAPTRHPRVADPRLMEERNARRRRRHCPSCGKRFLARSKPPNSKCPPSSVRTKTFALYNAQRLRNDLTAARPKIRPDTRNRSTKPSARRNTGSTLRVSATSLCRTCRHGAKRAAWAQHGSRRPFPPPCTNASTIRQTLPRGWRKPSKQTAKPDSPNPYWYGIPMFRTQIYPWWKTPSDLPLWDVFPLRPIRASAALSHTAAKLSGKASTSKQANRMHGSPRPASGGRNGTRRDRLCYPRTDAASTDAHRPAPKLCSVPAKHASSPPCATPTRWLQAKGLPCSKQQASRRNAVYSNIRQGNSTEASCRASNAAAPSSASHAPFRWTANRPFRRQQLLDYGEDARADIQVLRAESCAVLTGIGTVLADNPRLNVRAFPTLRNPHACVLDSRLRLPLDSHLLDRRTISNLHRHSGTSMKINSRPYQTRTHPHPDAVTNGRRQNRRLNHLMRLLADKKVSGEIMVEAGSELTSAFTAEDPADEIVLYRSPKILGSNAKTRAPARKPRRPFRTAPVDTRSSGNPPDHDIKTVFRKTRTPLKGLRRFTI